VGSSLMRISGFDLHKISDASISSRFSGGEIRSTFAPNKASFPETDSSCLIVSSEKYYFFMHRIGEGGGERYQGERRAMLSPDCKSSCSLIETGRARVIY